MLYIYILELVLNKYYIGKTSNPDLRLESHFNADGSAWTKMYKPVKLLELISDCDSYDEDKYTLKYMEKKGIDNVRGGSFSQIKLSDEQINLINQMINGASDKCFNCGKSGHFVKDCIEIKINEYLENIINIKNEITKINSIYEEIIELKELIKLTNRISIDDLPEIKKQSRDIIELNKLLDRETKLNNDLAKFHKMHNTNRGLVLNQLEMKERSKINSQINEIQLEIRTKSSNINSQYNWKQIIHGYYLKKINNDRKNLNKDIIILGLELIKFNLEKKKRLKEIFNDYYNEEFVKILLSKLYEKDLETMKSELLSLNSHSN